MANDLSSNTNPQRQQVSTARQTHLLALRVRIEGYRPKKNLKFVVCLAAVMGFRFDQNLKQ